MSSWGDLVQNLETDGEELGPDQLADLWILLGARSGSYAAGTALVALADVDVAVRAMSHVVSPVDDQMSKASRGFLRNLVAHSSETEIDAWVQAASQALSTTARPTDPEAVLAAVRATLDGVGEGRWAVAQRGTGNTHLLVRFLAGRLSPDERLTAAAQLASLHPDLGSEDSASIRSLLSTVAIRDRLVEDLAGEPRHIIAAEQVANSVLRQARIAGEAIASIWEYPMLEPGAAAVRLGAKPSNREKVRTYRDRGWLVGLPKGRGYLYPQFQFDPESQDVYPEVRRTNELLDAVRDPWGVASWWTRTNDRLDARPVDFVGTSRGSEIEFAAQALVEPVG